jgi:uncharacterized membrane protein
MAIHRLLRSAESVTALDRPVTELVRRVRRAVGGTRVERVLRGSWLGHPVHPLLVTLPIGAWTCAAVADLVLKDRDAGRALVGVGLLATPPAVLTGLVELSTVDGLPGRRVGALHAAANTATALCFLLSYRHRSRGEQRAGVVWTLLGLTATGVGGALGGHLAYALGAGVRRED